MPFPFFNRLSAREQAVYRRSDEIASVPLPSPERLWPFVKEIEGALTRDDHKAVEAAAGQMARTLLDMLKVPPVKVEVLAVRPSSSWGELHGLYTEETRGPARIRLWMRTARHRRVVAFRTFLRTLLHEIGHHLDYRHLRLPESYHTEGFFKRESSLFRQIAPDLAPRQGTPRRARTGRREKD